MLTPIEFYYQFCFMAIEVNDIITNDLLAMNTNLKPAQKLVIQLIFLAGRVVAQFPRLIFETFFRHASILPNFILTSRAQRRILKDEPPPDLPSVSLRAQVIVPL